MSSATTITRGEIDELVAILRQGIERAMDDVLEERLRTLDAAGAGAAGGPGKPVLGG